MLLQESKRLARSCISRIFLAWRIRTVRGTRAGSAPIACSSIERSDVSEVTRPVLIALAGKDPQKTGIKHILHVHPFFSFLTTKKFLPSHSSRCIHEVRTVSQLLSSIKGPLCYFTACTLRDTKHFLASIVTLHTATLHKRAVSKAN